MVHLLLTPVVFVLVGPPVGAVAALLTTSQIHSGASALVILGGYAVGGWPAFVAGIGHVCLSGTTERVLRRAQLPASCGSLLGVLSAVCALVFCFPGEYWWQLSKVARELLLPSILAGAVAGAVSAAIASKLAQDMAPE